MRGADIGSDHQLVISKIKLKLKRTDKKDKLERRRYDIKKLRSPDYNQRFILELRNRFTALEGMEEEKDVKKMWENIKTVFNESAEIVSGKRRKDVKDWMSEDTMTAIEERKRAKQKINSTRSTRSVAQYMEKYKALNKDVKHKCRRDKREYVNKLIEETESAAAKGEQDTLYIIIKKISAKYSNGSQIVRDKDGNILSKDKDIQERWEEHFREVLNREPPDRPVRIEKGRYCRNIKTENIQEDEIRSAIKRLKNKKSPGMNNISGELVKADIETSTKWLKRIYDKIWTEEKTPREWSKGIIVTLPKKEI